MSQGNTVPTRSPLTRNEIAARVLPILAEEAGMTCEDLRESHTLTEILDSLSIVEAVMGIEEEFDIDISDDAVEGMRTVGDVINGMCTLLGA